MLQRIQSIFFLLAIIVNFAVLFTPVWQFSEAGQIEVLNGLAEMAPESEGSSVNFFEHQDPMKSVLHSVFMGMIVLSGAYILWLIFQFNDRPRQIRLGYIGAVLILVEILALVLLTQQGPEYLSASAASTPGYGMIFPIVAVFLVFLGIRGIRKDEEKVRSVDRIR
ncbi:MAG: DUF4293 domain-containing protein [Bacteroidota bacterium]